MDGAGTRDEGRLRGQAWYALAVAFAVFFFLPKPVAADNPDVSDQEMAYHALHVAPEVPAQHDKSLAWLTEHADKRAVASLVHLMRWQPEDVPTLRKILQRITGDDVGPKWFDWMVWLQEHPDYTPHEIRLEEIVWGGVRVDAIPALDNPKMISAVDAEYLNADDLVFGVEIGGEAKAYPLRIVNWHEMVNDVVGGTPVSLAYSTLCNAGILYAAQVAGRDQRLTFGSSGLLYRSNKLMYDRGTDSLWDQFTGRPVVGPLVGSNVSLRVLPLVTTQWHLWRAKHPTTKVLSLDTGFSRDYGPDAAYRDYFNSKDLMFPAAVKDRRLQQKDLVFGLRAAGGTKAWPLAAFAGGKVIHDKVGLVEVVLIGNAEQRTVRAYESKGHKFTMSAPDLLRASDGYWRITEDALVHSDGKTLARLPGHLAYWFAWSGFFENATLGGN